VTSPNCASDDGLKNMCLMSSVRWSDWTGKATERSSETTQREVDETMWRAPESARECSNENPPKNPPVSSVFHRQQLSKTSKKKKPCAALFIRDLRSTN